jgi:hypothetical protein
VIADDEPHHTEGVPVAVAEVQRPNGALGRGSRGPRVEDVGGPLELAEHPPRAGRLRRRDERAGRQLLGDAREAAQRGFVRACVEGERSVIGQDRERLGRDDLSAVDIGGHDVPGDLVLRLVAEDRPRRRVEPAVAG